VFALAFIYNNEYHTDTATITLIIYQHN